MSYIYSRVDEIKVETFVSDNIDKIQQEFFPSLVLTEETEESEPHEIGQYVFTYFHDTGHLDIKIGEERANTLMKVGIIERFNKSTGNDFFNIDWTYQPDQEIFTFEISVPNFNR